MVDILKEYGLRRLTVTGGEPMILDGEELFDFLRYVHQKQIHVCLSTNGYRLTQARVEEMDGYVDQILLPIRSLTRPGWQVDFGDTPYTLELFETVINLLQWIKTTSIILEVSTVVHRENIGKVMDLGWQLVSLNPNIVWRLEEYYGMGIRADLRSRFEIGERELDLLFCRVHHNFEHLLKLIRPGKGKGRIYAPDLFITPVGDLVTTSNNCYSEPVGNVLKGQLPPEFRNRRPWSDYQQVCRDWDWGDL